jgi:hypothetical protein
MTMAKRQTSGTPGSGIERTEVEIKDQPNIDRGMAGNKPDVGRADTPDTGGSGGTATSDEKKITPRSNPDGKIGY